MENKKRTLYEIWTRSVGYLRPVSSFNEGKRQEVEDRVLFKLKE